MELDLRALTAEDTRAIGEALAPLLRPRDAVVLTGELGAGKTTFVQGVARGLGIEDQVVSPTFTLIKEYTGRLDVAHVDVYRLDRVQDVVDLGLDELGTGEDVLLVEWGDAVEALLPPDRLRVEFATEDPAGGTRRAGIQVTGVGHVLDAALGRGAGRPAALGGRAVIVVGIETSTPQTSVALGTEQEILAKVSVAGQGPPGIGDPGAAAAAGVDRASTWSTWAGSRSGSGRACSPACGSAWRPRRRSRRSSTCRSWASPASTRSPTPAATRTSASPP